MDDLTPTGAPQSHEFGPCMMKCSPTQQKFVVGIMQGLGDTNAALAAGCLPNPNNKSHLSVMAYRLRNHPLVREAIFEMSRSLGQVTAVPMAIRTFIDSMRDAPDAKDRNKAAAEICDRFGLPAISEQKMSVTHKDETTVEVMKQIASMAKGLGIDPKKLLGGNVIEGEVEEVPEDEDDLSDIL